MPVLALLAAVGACAGPPTSPAYATKVAAALRSGRDVWGERLLAAPGGPTVARARSFLPPLLWARGPHGRPLTDTGVYYVPFATPGAPAAQLHVADGSEIIARRVGGRALRIFVGKRGTEQFGSCRARAGQPRLAGGWLPILETRYADATGGAYRQESFATRVGGRLTSFVRLDVDAARVITVSAGRLRFHLRHGSVFFAWPALRRVSPETYAAARQSVVGLWQTRLAQGMSISVPDREITNAQRAVLVQDLELTWRYSIGNPYEEFSFPESVDIAEVLAEEGYADVAKSMLRVSLTRKSTPYPNWKRGERLVAVAEIYRLDRDTAFIHEVTPVLRGYVAALGRQVAKNGGLLDRERYSSDIPSSVYGLHSQTVVWQGLRAMAHVWAATGDRSLASASMRVADRLGRAIADAVRADQRRLSDGTLFLPVALRSGEQPYGSVTEARLGSYWNLVMPFALASGFFAPHGAQARGILSYMQNHGSRLLGLVRAGAYALYGRGTTASGTDAVYDLNMARFLADNDEADELALSLVGQVAACMTPGTFVAGEAASVTPLGETRERAMYLPPNSAANAAFLETLRSTLVHETRDRAGEPAGLELAFATPRTWLQPGRRIRVQNAPTSFGPVSFAITSGVRRISATVSPPARGRPRTFALRLRTHVRSVTIDGRSWRRFDPRTGTIEFPAGGSEITLVATRSTA